MKAVAFVALLLVALSARAEQHPDEFYDPDVQRLSKAEYFAFGGVGAGGATSDGEAAFAAILKKEKAIRFILAAFDAGTPEARCYALVALREWSPKLFAQSFATLVGSSPKKITTMRGCLIMDEEPPKVLSRIENGDYASFFETHEKG